jgi:4-carboxymuconolactone decarboxylase
MPPIPPHRMTAAQRDAAAEIAAGPRGELAGPFVAAVRSPEYMCRLQRLGEYLRYEMALPPRLREMVILLTARRWRQDYEWWTHAPLARAAGLPGAIIDAIAAGTPPPGLEPDEALVAELCAALHRDARLSDGLYARAVAALGEQGVIDLIGAVGYYTTLAMIMNVTRTSLPDGEHGPEWGA